MLFDWDKEKDLYPNFRFARKFQPSSQISIFFTSPSIDIFPIIIYEQRFNLFSQLTRRDGMHRRGVDRNVSHPFES